MYYVSDLNKLHEDDSETIICKSCKEKKGVDSFKDENGQIGTVCNDCKTNEMLCPLCNSKMVLRSGRYGKFFGCSKFPYCRGTRKYEG